jgi:hypothetical protein
MASNEGHVRLEFWATMQPLLQPGIGIIQICRFPNISQDWNDMASARFSSVGAVATNTLERSTITLPASHLIHFDCIALLTTQETTHTSRHVTTFTLQQ